MRTTITTRNYEIQPDADNTYRICFARTGEYYKHISVPPIDPNMTEDEIDDIVNSN